MVQVDIFWSYAIGASLSLAAWRQFEKLKEAPSSSAITVSNEDKKKYPCPFENMYFIITLLYVAVLFAPSGIYLLWAFPSWETMHVGTYETIPAWLVALFAITNVTQGILGYWITHRLYMAKKYYPAFLQVIISYFLMFFILVNGWDKTGYMRFFSATREDFLHWDVAVGVSWLTSNVALTLYGMGVILIPVMLYFLCSWIKEGYSTDVNVDQERARKTGIIKILILLLSMVFLVCLGFAIIATLLIHFFDWVPGLLILAIVLYIAGLSRWGFFYFIFNKLTLLDNQKQVKNKPPKDIKFKASNPRIHP